MARAKRQSKSAEKLELDDDTAQSLALNTALKDKDYKNRRKPDYNPQVRRYDLPPAFILSEGPVPGDKYHMVERASYKLVAEGTDKTSAYKALTQLAKQYGANGLVQTKHFKKSNTKLTLFGDTKTSASHMASGIPIMAGKQSIDGKYQRYEMLLVNDRLEKVHKKLSAKRKLKSFSLLTLAIIGGLVSAVFIHPIVAVFPVAVAFWLHKEVGIGTWLQPL